MRKNFSFLTICYVILSACSNSSECNSYLSNKCDSLVRAEKNHPSIEKQILKAKQKLFNEICSKSADTQRMLIIFEWIGKSGNYQGIVYNYDSLSTDTFQQDTNQFQFGVESEKNDNLVRLIDHLKDSPVEKINARKKEKSETRDGGYFTIFYLDRGKNDYHLLTVS